MRTGADRTEIRRRPAARVVAVGLAMGLGCGAISFGFILRGPIQADATGSAPMAGAAANGYGPGVGPQNPGQHWGGAYTLANVGGYAYCIQPGGADPLELPADQWSPTSYPGSAVYTDGEMAALAYFAERYQGTGYPGWTVNETVAAIEQVAYASAGGSTPSSSQGPAPLVALIEQYMVTYAGPWTISLSMTPPSGSTFDVGANYSGTITVRSATGNGVAGLELTAPPSGGPGANQVSNFVWLTGSTNAEGQISFQWNISGVPSAFGGAFSAQGIDVVGDAVGTAPPAYAALPGTGGQLMLVSGASEVLGTSFGGIATEVPTSEQGTVSIQKTVPDASYFGPAGAQFEIEDGNGNVFDTLTTRTNGSTPVSVPLDVSPSGSPYRVHEIVAPPGYGLATDQVVMVYPGQHTVASFSGTSEEPVEVAQLGAEKIDAQTGQPLAGATFDFEFDSANNRIYNQDLGTCTTSGSGICQPSVENAPGGWLPGWYQVTETAAPPGYWLDPATQTQTLFLQPGAATIASVTFGDELLGSLRLVKSGNDTAYWPVTGATFSVTGPAPSAATVGTLTVTTDGSSNILSGLVPGTYTLTEMSPPPGYNTIPPFTVTVTAGHTTTTVTVTDPIQPGSISIRKVDRTTGDPLSGATFDVRYDSANNGTFGVDLGTCITSASGTCAPPPSDSTGYLPGNYLVTEIAAPSGYYLSSPPPSQEVTVTPGGTGSVSFSDPLLVPVQFHKVATGSYNPTQLDLSGAVIDVTNGSTPGGSIVATCTTDAEGDCATASVLVSGQSYCWQEVSAPAGLQSGAAGCFTANNSLGAQPILVTDPGLFVGIAVKKIDAGNPSAVLPGAVYDLFRVDGGSGPNRPQPPAGVVAPSGQTWVARATSEGNGIATFPLQLPGYSYCVQEVTAPPGYVLDPSQHCTAVLAGTVTTVTTTLTLTDTEARVTVSAHKFNSSVPDTGIPGAVYDLYVEGQSPPSGPPSSPPQGVATEPDGEWWARGTTTNDGVLSFSVPAGYAWCFHEVSAPTDYDLDPALHCTAVINTDTPPASTTVALPETLSTVYVGAHKYNAKEPGTVIPGASYELLLDGTAVPPGFDSPQAPTGSPVPSGDIYWTQGTTDSQGRLSFAVPAGYRWCLRELAAPPGYQPDTSYHCTSVITENTPTNPTMVALPEIPVVSTALPSALTTLAFTGGPALWLIAVGLLLVTLGGLLWVLGRLGDRNIREPKDLVYSPAEKRETNT
jgi:Prealbumin-like fold domain